MSGEKNENPNEELEFDDNANDDLDEILDEKNEKEEEKNEDDEEESEEEKNKNKEEKNEVNKFFKKVGNREFTSEKDYDKFVQDTYNTNSRFAGEIKKLGGNPKQLSKALDNAEKKTEVDNKAEDKKEDLSDEERYYRIEAVRFNKQFSEAKEYKDEMQVFIRKGRANINGEPSYALALAKALRADGKQIPQRLITRIKAERGDDDDSKDNRTISKKVMKSGGSNSNSGAAGQETYTDDDVESLSDFGNKIASGGPRF